MKYLYTITGDMKGPTAVILGAVHGDERVGAVVVKRLSKILRSRNIRGRLCGTIYLMIGNPRAYKLNQRFVDTDLNRLFGEYFPKLAQKKESDVWNYERLRASEVARILQKADFLLDIHSTIRPSVPFVFTAATKSHLALAKFFDTRYIVSVDPAFKPEELVSSTDNFVDAAGGIGITYESGWLKGADMAEEVLYHAQRFLKATGVAPFDISEMRWKRPVPHHLFITSEIRAETRRFSFSKNWKNFDAVSRGDILATDGKRIIRASRRVFLIFPKQHILQGQLACYLAVLRHTRHISS